MKKRYKVLLILLILLVLAVVTEPFTHLYHRLADTLIYNNYRHYLPCRALPDLAEVEAVVAAHADLIARIEAVSPGTVDIEIDSLSCAGKGSVVIYYASKADRERIEAILPERDFFGVPLSLINR